MTGLIDENSVQYANFLNHHDLGPPKLLYAWNFILPLVSVTNVVSDVRKTGKGKKSPFTFFQSQKMHIQGRFL